MPACLVCSTSRVVLSKSLNSSLTWKLRIVVTILTSFDGKASRSCKETGKWTLWYVITLDDIGLLSLRNADF